MLTQREQFVEEKLLAKAHDPAIRAAWEMRNVDPNEARQWMAKAEIAYRFLMQNPTQNAQQIEALKQRYAVAQIAANAKSVLTRLQHQIVADARKHVASLIDEEATADRNMVAQAVRGASGPAPPEPAPDFSTIIR